MPGLYLRLLLYETDHGLNAIRWNTRDGRLWVMSVRKSERLYFVPSQLGSEICFHRKSSQLQASRAKKTSRDTFRATPDGTGV